MKFRSKFEKRIWENHEKGKLEYEPADPPIVYTTSARYIPDFALGNSVFVEAKGYFDSKARGKMARVKKQHPELDIRILFQRANNRITKSPNSMMYWQWAEKHGFPWYEGDRIPDSWFNKESKD